MSGNPGDIPKFVDDMIKPSVAKEATATLAQIRPKSEVAHAVSDFQPSCDTRPKSDTTRPSDATRPLSQIHQNPDVMREKESSKPADCGHFAFGELRTMQYGSQSGSRCEEKLGTVSKVKPDELREKESSKPADCGHFTSGEVRTMQYDNRSAFRCEEKLGTGSKDKKSDELREKESSKPADCGYFTSGQVGTTQYGSQSASRCGGKAGTGLKDEKALPMTISKETQQLVDELQRQYSRPVFINDGVQLFMDDVKERSMLSSSGDRYRQKSEQCK